MEKLRAADVWTCECRDFMNRLVSGLDVRCKHIMACQMLQDSVREASGIESVNLPKICPKCNSSIVTKHGLRKLKNDSKRQMYFCKQCKYKFSLCETGFSRVSSNPKIIIDSISMHLYGMSSRKISRHIKSTYGQNVSHVAVYKWVEKYMDMIEGYVNSIEPNTGDVWSVDEMVLNVKCTEKLNGKGFHVWLWNIIDPKTKFVLATVISKRRETSDARNVIKKGMETTPTKPSYVITDSLKSYESAIRNMLGDGKTAHVKTRSLKDGFANRPVERFNNEIREITKTRRGLGNDKSAQKFADAQRINHNFIRDHTGLPNNITPAEAAGIDLGLGDNKVGDLISQSSRKKSFITQLGERVNLVSIVTETDSIWVIPKAWIEKRIWREINDILGLNGFVWVPNGRHGCWIKADDGIKPVDIPSLVA